MSQRLPVASLMLLMWAAGPLVAGGEPVVTEALQRYGPGTIGGAAYSPDGKYILTGGGKEGRDAVLWETETAKAVRTFSGHQGYVRCGAFSPDGTKVLTGSDDNTAKLWSTADGSLLRSFPGELEWGIASVAFSPDREKILTGSGYRAKLWDASDGTLLRTFSGHRDQILSVALSRDATKVLTGSRDRTAKVWSAADGKALLTLDHDRGVLSVAFSPDATKILTGCEDKTAKLWKADGGALLRTFSGHTSEVMSVAFSPDGSKVLTGGDDRKARLWNAADGTLLRTFSGHAGAVQSVAFAPDGTRVLTGGQDGTARLWSAFEERATTATRPFEGLRALVVEPENFWGWDAAVFGALQERGFDVTYAKPEAVEDAAALSQYDIVASNIKRSFSPAQSANLKRFVAEGGALYGSWGGPMGNGDLLRDVCRVASTRSVRIAGMSLLPDTPLSKGIAGLDMPFPTLIGHAASKTWEIVAVAPLEGGIAVAKDSAGNTLGVLAQHGKGRTAILGFGPEKEKQFVRREVGPQMMDNLLAWLLEERLKAGPRRWSGAVEVALPVRAEIVEVRLGDKAVAKPEAAEVGSLKKIKVDVSGIRDGEEATIKVAYKPLDAGRNIETLIHLPWGSLPRGGPPAKLAEWLKSVGATIVQPLLREPDGHAYYRGMPEDTPDPVSVTGYQGNFLADFIEECHKRGIQVIGGIYLESRTTLKRHPEAALVEKSGAKSTTQACFNCPDGREYNLATIKQLLDNYKLDGLILDDNYELENYDCHCPFCKKGFEHFLAAISARAESHAMPGWGRDPLWLGYRQVATRELAETVAEIAHGHRIPAGGWVGASMNSAYLGVVFDFLGGMVYTEPPRSARLMLSLLGKCRFFTLLWAPGERPERMEQEFREAVHAGSAVAGFWVYPPGHDGAAGMKMLPGSHEAIGRAFAKAEEEWLNFYRDNLLTGDTRFVVLDGKAGPQELLLRVKNAGKRPPARIQGAVDLDALGVAGGG